MGISITKNTLSRFKSRVENLKNVADSFAELFIKEAMQIANEKYKDSPELNLLYYEKVEDGVYRLVAEGEQLCYIEFGTGTAGNGTYPNPDKLPTQTLVFDSRGRKGLETPGWVYNYYKNLYVSDEDKPKFKDYKGHEAYAQMYHTAEELGRMLGDIAKKYVKEKKK